jgi:cell division protein FtsI (penicillin-binding protein 3)
MTSTRAPERRRPAPRRSDQGRSRSSSHTADHRSRGSWASRKIRLGDPSRRAGALILATGVVFSIFAVRLIELQAVRGTALASEALDQRQRTVGLPASRGAILDASGEPLAVTVDAVNVTADPSLITDPIATAIELAPILGMDAAELAVTLSKSGRFAYVKKAISPETWARVSALNLPGILQQSTSKRVYPGGDLAANVIGFMNADGEGAGGLEFGMQEILAGEDGSRTYERVSGKALPTAPMTVIDAKPGSDVALTIDRDIQHVAQGAIATAVQRAGADWGSVVVMDPRTGDILALAEAPTFDANKPTEAAPDDRGNRSLTAMYEPGSTGKVISLSGVVNEGKATPYSAFGIPSKLKWADTVINDHDEHGRINLTLTGIMAKSSNIGTVLATKRLGKAGLYRYGKLFGIGEPTGLNFPGETMGSIPAPGRWSATTFPTLAFGQGYAVNTVQAASVFATIANDGVRVPPRLISKVISPDGSATEIPIGKPVTVISPETAQQVRAMLEAATQDGGTGTNARIAGYRIGGKTGTAQMIGANGRYNGDVIASFIGMAPVDQPELVVAVTIVDPRSGRYGGEIGAPVFRQVMNYGLQKQQVPPTGTKPVRLPLGG